MQRLILNSVVVFGSILISGIAQAEDRPNILLVMADDLGWSDIGSYGGEIETPRLDELAAQGVLFTDFHASVSCSPTRAMLMSGNDNHIAGLGTMREMLVDNQRGQPGYEGYLNDRVAALPEILQSAGYNTYMAGKWHLGHSEDRLPFTRGFDTTLTMLVGGASHWADRLGILPEDDPAKYASNGQYLETLPADFYSSRSYADFLIDSIRAGRDNGNPFFGYLAFTAPHDPVHVPEPWMSKYDGWYDEGYDVLKTKRWTAAKDLGLIPEDAPLPGPQPLTTPWENLQLYERQTEARGMEVYAGMVDAMDYHYGRVVDFLEDVGELDNTIIVFLSDNGSNPFYSVDYPGADDPEFIAQFDHSYENLGHPGSNYAYGPGFAAASSGALGLYKQTVGEGGIRVPLIISGPGISKDQKTGAFAYVWDILPTLLDAAGVEYPATFDGRQVEPPRGRSMLPLLTGDVNSLYGPDEIVAGEMAGGKWARKGDFKAVLVPAPYGDGNWHLFDLASDPGESIDLSGSMPELLLELTTAWEAYSEEVGVVPAQL